MTPPPRDEAEFVLDRFLPYVLSAASNRVLRLFAHHHLAEFGLTIPEWRVMAIIGRFGTTGATAISERTAMDKVKVSRAVASLLQRDLLRRAADPADGRAWMLSFTRKGRTVYGRVMPRAQALNTDLTAAISRKDVATFRSVLARLEARVAELGGTDADTVSDD